MDWFGGKAAFIEFIKNYKENISFSKFFLENENDDDYIDLPGFKNLAGLFSQDFAAIM